MTPYRDYGPTGYCSTGRHDGCPYRIGGACEGGIWVPECYVTLPPKGGHKGGAWPSSKGLGIAASIRGEALLKVVRPSHVSVCGCDCHVAQVRVGQLELFEVA